MKPETEKLVTKYLNFGGNKNYNDFAKFLKEIMDAKYPFKIGTHDYKLLDYVQSKIIHGMQLSAEWGTIYVMVDEDSIEDIEDAINGEQLEGAKKKKPVKRNKKKRGDDLGKIVDTDEVPEGNSDIYWGRTGIDLVFKPNDEQVRIGEKIPSEYKYADMRYLEKYYGLKAFEFGNWLSQQDRVNYLSGLGLGLFDLHKLLGFSPKQIGIKGKLSIAFGARGRGSAAAHFEPAAFVINLTRYSRPKALNARSQNFRRVNLILQDGGVGAFAHEFAHALDYYSGTFIDEVDSWQISGGRSLDHALRFPSAKKSKIQDAMDNVLNKILWKGKNVQSEYSVRLNKKGTKPYYRWRNEIFARSFEVYVHYKLQKQKHKNVFLNKSKYPERFYLTIAELKKIEKEYDALIAEIRKHI